MGRREDLIYESLPVSSSFSRMYTNTRFRRVTAVTPADYSYAPTPALRYAKILQIRAVLEPNFLPGAWSSAGRHWLRLATGGY